MTVKDSDLVVGKVFSVVKGPYAGDVGTLQGYTKASVQLAWPGVKDHGLWFLKEHVQAVPAT